MDEIRISANDTPVHTLKALLRESADDILAALKANALRTDPHESDGECPQGCS